MDIAEFVDSKEVSYWDRIWAANIRKSLIIGTASDDMVEFLREMDVDFAAPMLCWDEWLNKLIA